MRALLNFMHRGGWSFHIVAEDCQTVLVGYRNVASQEQLLRIIAKLSGSVEEARQSIERWARGSVWIDPSPAQCKALGIVTGQNSHGSSFTKSRVRGLILQEEISTWQCR